MRSRQACLGPCLRVRGPSPLCVVVAAYVRPASHHMRASIERGVGVGAVGRAADQAEHRGVVAVQLACSEAVAEGRGGGGGGGLRRLRRLRRLAEGVVSHSTISW